MPRLPHNLEGGPVGLEGPPCLQVIRHEVSFEVGALKPKVSPLTNLPKARFTSFGHTFVEKIVFNPELVSIFVS